MVSKISDSHTFACTKKNSIDNASMDAIKISKALDNYFKLLKEVMEENNLMNMSGKISDVDELDILIDHQPPHVMTLKRQ